MAEPIYRDRTLLARLFWRPWVSRVRDHMAEHDRDFSADRIAHKESMRILDAHLLALTRPAIKVCKCPSCGTSFLPWVPVDTTPNAEKSDGPPR